MADSPNDISQCHGPVAGDGCGGNYPNKTSAGLCEKCTSIEGAGTKEEEARIEVSADYYLPLITH